MFNFTTIIYHYHLLFLHQKNYFLRKDGDFNLARLKRINNKIYDIGTANISWLQLASDLKELGVKNWYFMLELKDPSLIAIDPYKCDDNGNCTLTRDEIARVVTECRRNPWYYLREVARIPDPGNPKGIPYRANRGNIAQAFLFLHGIDSWLCLPRRTCCLLI